MSHGTVETVAVQSDEPGHKGFKVINLSDFNAEIHKVYEGFVSEVEKVSHVVMQGVRDAVDLDGSKEAAAKAAGSPWALPSTSQPAPVVVEATPAPKPASAAPAVVDPAPAAEEAAS
jgi:hypothetical protein